MLSTSCPASTSTSYLLPDIHPYLPPAVYLSLLPAIDLPPSDSDLLSIQFLPTIWFPPSSSCLLSSGCLLSTSCSLSLCLGFSFLPARLYLWRWRTWRR